MRFLALCLKVLSGLVLLLCAFSFMQSSNMSKHYKELAARGKLRAERWQHENDLRTKEYAQAGLAFALAQLDRVGKDKEAKEYELFLGRTLHNSVDGATVTLKPLSKDKWQVISKGYIMVGELSFNRPGNSIRDLENREARSQASLEATVHYDSVSRSWKRIK